MSLNLPLLHMLVTYVKFVKTIIEPFNKNINSLVYRVYLMYIQISERYVCCGFTDRRETEKVLFQKIFCLIYINADVV